MEAKKWVSTSPQLIILTHQNENNLSLDHLLLHLGVLGYVEQEVDRDAQGLLLLRDVIVKLLQLELGLILGLAGPLPLDVVGPLLVPHDLVLHDLHDQGPDLPTYEIRQRGTTSIAQLSHSFEKMFDTKKMFE